MSELTNSVDLLSLSEFQSTSSVPPASTGPQSSNDSSQPEFTPQTSVADSSQPAQRRTTVDMSGANTDFFSYLNNNKNGDLGEYDVKFPPGKVGVTLEPDVTGRQCIVKSFTQKKVGQVDDGLAKRSGMICVGDCIIAIDGESVLDLTFKQTMVRLRSQQDKAHTLTFKSISAGRDQMVPASPLCVKIGQAGFMPQRGIRACSWSPGSQP